MQGEAADAVFYIQEGKIKLTVLSDQEKETVVGILESGQFFGEGCLGAIISPSRPSGLCAVLQVVYRRA